MLTLGPLAFTAPWLLAGLLALPALWLILRVVPPAPIRRRFPGVALLLGLADDETQSDRTPWWLLLLRLLAVAALIFAFAGPVLNPQVREAGSGPMLILTDASWADARDWAGRLDRIEQLLTEAGRDGRPVAVVAATDLPAGGPEFLAADAWAPRLAALAPAAWAPDQTALADWASAVEEGFETVWLSDGLARPGREDALEALEAKGSVRVLESPRPVYGLSPPVYEDGAVVATVLRARAGLEAAVTLQAIGPDPTGTERVLATAEARFGLDDRASELRLVLPAELRNRITRFELSGIRSAGAVSLTDDALRRREVALIAGREDREGLELLSPLHYLENALAPTADLIDGAIADVLLANPDVLVLADVARLSDPEAVRDWVDGGGLLVRFAGPRLAASDVAVAEDDPLMPVRLRAGGRTVGGAMSWGSPKTLQPFDEESPFHGLAIPPDVVVEAQVLAQPAPELGERTIASLADGTPLVTQLRIGNGRIVLFHVTANAEWSSLPLSGLFVQMLERLAVSARPARPSADDLTGTSWQAVEVLTGFGDIEPAGTLPGVPGEALAEAVPGPEMPPGLYTSDERSVALNVLGPDAELAPAAWPSRIAVEGLDIVEETQLTGALLALAALLALVDLIASLQISGKLGLTLIGRAPAALALAALLAAAAPGALRAQEGQHSSDDRFLLDATREVSLGYVLTGNAQIDEVTRAGLDGLSQTLIARTSIEPASPTGVNLETDTLAVFPFLYWAVTPEQPTPSRDAYARLNEYLRTGGMILFDTRDADIGSFGSATPTGRKLQELALALDIPPLEPIPQDHVLTRTFYLLQDFPGRFAGRDLWVEAAPPDARQVEGMPFRDLNDGVTPVVIGGNDWAAAWALDDRGGRMFPVGRGYAGERQRELSFRFGVNLIMHVLTGNYKSDQVHVPALLDRLGN